MCVEISVFYRLPRNFGWSAVLPSVVALLKSQSPRCSEGMQADTNMLQAHSEQHGNQLLQFCLLNFDRLRGWVVADR